MWVVINTAGQGYTQKYAPELTFFKKKADAIKFLRSKIKVFIQEDYVGTTIIEFLRLNCITNFETNEGEFWLEQVVIA